MNNKVLSLIILVTLTTIFFGCAKKEISQVKISDVSQSQTKNNQPVIKQPNQTKVSKSQLINNQAINKAISKTIILKESPNYVKYETETEGHIILDTEERAGKVIAYTVSSFGTYGFENRKFVHESGCGAIPTVITFSINDKGEYSLIDYQTPVDGEDYYDSLKELFPEKLWDKVFSAEDYYPSLVKQKESQASRYLESIGRKAEISDEVTNKKLPEISSEASNIIGVYEKIYKLGNYPYWLGTIEQIENGTRYIYEKSKNKSKDNIDILTYTKKKEDGTVVNKYQFEIIGNEVNNLQIIIKKTGKPPISTGAEYVENNELWIRHPDGKEELLLTSRNDEDMQKVIGGIHDAKISPDAKKIYFMSSAWATSNSIHVVDIKSKKEKYVCPGNSLEVIQDGPYIGKIIVNQHRYNESGSYDNFYIVDDAGKTIKNLGENYKTF